MNAEDKKQMLALMHGLTALAVLHALLSRGNDGDLAGSDARKIAAEMVENSEVAKVLS